MLSAYLLHIAIILVIYILLAASLNIAVGYTGLLNLGHVAFFGIGAYTSTLLSLHHVPFALCMISGGILASIFGWLLAYITNKLRGDYLALATLGFSFVVFSILLNWTKLTRGPLGIPGIPKPSIFGFAVHNTLSYFIFALIILMFSLVILFRIVHSRYGRLLESVRDDEIGLSALGKNTARLKSQSLMISTFFAGIAGCLFAHYLSYIDPSSFFISDLIIIFTIVIVGGLASLKGTIFAGIIIILLPELLRFIDMPSYMVGPMRQMIYAVILLAILRFRPHGLFGKINLD